VTARVNARNVAKSRSGHGGSCRHIYAAVVVVVATVMWSTPGVVVVVVVDVVTVGASSWLQPVAAASVMMATAVVTDTTTPSRSMKACSAHHRRRTDHYRRPSFLLHVGHARHPASARTRSATVICWTRDACQAYSANSLPPYARQVAGRNCRPPS
jgi:hypothetical protein